MRRKVTLVAILLLLALLGTLLAAAFRTSAQAAWAPNTAYAIGVQVTYNGRLYQVQQAHTSQVGWEPPNVPALYLDKGPIGTSPTATNTSAPPTATRTRTNTTGTGATATRTRTRTPTGPTATRTRTNTTGTGATATRTRTNTSGGATATRTRTNTSVPPTATSTTGTGTPCWTPWSSSQVYTNGMQASDNGRNYQANWWNQSDRPSTSTSGAWADKGACGGTTPPTATRTNTTGTGATATRTRTNTIGTGPTNTVTRTPTQGTPPPGGRMKVGYFAQWGIYARAYYVKNIDTSGSAAKLTHINYSFGNVVNNRCEIGINQQGRGDAWADYQKGFDAATSVDGVADAWEQPIKGNFNQLKKLKAKHPHLKILISLGGWTWSDGFYSAAQPANRAAFVQSCIDIYIKGNIPADLASGITGGNGAAAGVFDGIDIDWEYPGICGNTANCGASAADKANFTELMREFRRQLDAVRPGLLLTAAVGAGPDKIDQLDIPGLVSSMNFINLMTYDFFGAWSPTGPTAMHSALDSWAQIPQGTNGSTAGYYSKNAVNLWIQRGFPANKLNLGVPMYGRGWTGVTTATPGGSASGPGPCSGFVGCEAGITDYKELVNRGLSKSYVGGTTVGFGNGQWWSFDDTNSMATKMAYIKSAGLGGAMAWSLDGDTANGELMNAIHVGLQ